LNTILVGNTPNGPVFVRDVATVVDTYKKATSNSRDNGQMSVGMLVLKQASANTIATAEAVKRTVAQLQPDLPPDVNISIVADDSVYTRSSLNDLQRELTTAVFLTGLILLVFLHTLRSTVIVLLAIPTSLIATLAAMYFSGLTLNTMSMIGLTMTIGILVDDSIVVLENIFRHLQLGEEPREAALNGRSEIGFAAIAITLVDVVVFAPIAFMSSFVGQYMRQFGLVIVAATLFSLFVSFTLTPMLASRWYHRTDPNEVQAARTARNPLAAFGRRWDAGFERLEHGYRHVLRFAIGRRSRYMVVAVGLASIAGAMWLAASGVLSTEFMPEPDDGKLQVGLEMPAGTTLDVTDAATKQLEGRIMALPEVKEVFTTVGQSDTGQDRPRNATLFVQRKDRRARMRTTAQVGEEIHTFGSETPGARLTAGSVSQFAGGGAPVAVRIQGEDQAVIAGLAQDVVEIVRRVPGTRDIDDGGVTGQPELIISIDSKRAADLGLTEAQVAGVLRTGLAGSTVSTFRPEGTSGWDVNVILNPEERSRLDRVPEIPIVTPTGTSIKLGQIAHITSAPGPTQILRYNRQRTLNVTAHVSGRPTGDVAADIQAGLDRMALPSGYKIQQGALSEAQSDSFAQIGQALGLSVVLMYMLETALFESLLYPFIVLLSLPLAIVGAFGLLTLTGNTLNMLSMIGLILLFGLVGKPAILLVDYTNRLREEGLGRDQSLLRAGPTRLRPILMTSAAVVMAMLPIAIKMGEGAEVYAPLAVTVIGGMITSTVLTLVFIPTVYTIFDDLSGLVTSIPRFIGSLRGRKVARRLSLRPIAALFSILLAVTAACAPSASGRPAETPTPVASAGMPVPGIAAAPPGRLEIFSWWTTGGEEAGLNAVLDVYRQQNPGVQIINATVAGGGGSNARAVLKSRMQGGDPPDTFQVHMGHELTDTWVVANKMQPLDDIYTQMGFDTAFPLDVLEIVSYDGHPYSIPLNVHRANVLWYNKQIFAENGLQPPDTFDDFFRIADILQAKGITPLAFANREGFEGVQTFETTALGVLGPDGYEGLWTGETAWTDPRLTQTLETYRRMLRYVNSDYSGRTWDQADDLVISGKAAMLIMGDWADGDYTAKRFVDFGWTATPGTGGTYDALSDTFGLPRGAKDVEQAKNWLRLIGTSEVQDAFNPLKGSVPANINAGNGNYDTYLRSAIQDWRSQRVVPSLAHGAAASEGWTAAITDAMTVFVSKQDVASTQAALQQACVDARVCQQ
jgi:HAE1 family hydrophobic/amphiphilic exporter-1